MATWRYLATELDGTPIAELPLNGVKITQRLRAMPTLNAQLLIPDDDVLAAVTVDATAPVRRALVAERDSVPIWAGLFVARNYRTATRTFTLTGAGWWWAFKKRLINLETNYSAIDQGAVAASLVTTIAQTQKSGGDLGVTAEPNTHGVLRSAEYPHYELRPIAEAVEQLAAVEGGFDWSIDSAYNAGVLEHVFRTSYPRRGRTASQSGFVFELGRNIVELDVNEDGSQCANSINGVGAGQGDDMVSVIITDTSALTEGYPLLEQQVAWKGEEDQSVLAQRVRAHLAAYSRPVETWKATVLADADPPLGSYITGDEARLRVQPGDNHRWPDGYDAFHRIIELTVDVPQQGTETVEITFGVAGG